ncbi:ARM repeat-containing protein [Backusella circina FSU 941]|nr:ARM repeat-containing protein [Backusella circina FSU 941]
MKRAIDQKEDQPKQQCKSLNELVTSKSMQNLALGQGADFDQLPLNLLNSEKTEERVQCLHNIATSLSMFSTEEHKIVIELLTERLLIEDNNDIKGMLILIFEKSGYIPNLNVVRLLTHLIDQLDTKSTRVKWQLYNCFYHILNNRSIKGNESILIKLFQHLIPDLSDPHHKVRSKSVTLLSLIPFVNEHEGMMSKMEVQQVISNYVLDNDPRVRKSALDALVQMHLRGCPLDLEIYNLAVSSLRDDYEEVRMGGLNLMGVLSSLYPNHRMKLAHEQMDETTRLIDDAFNKVCDLINDASVVIRTKACVMMASYQQVGPNTLAQTFSKQIMSHLRRNVPRYKKQQKYQHSIIPVAEGDIDVGSDEFHLLDSGACGAFIHGLEDEYQEVRNASIDSICELCMYNDQLIKKAVECLVDMFNDEIDKIRVNAIQSLRKIGTRAILEFNDEQLEVSVGALQDSDTIARQATHDLFTVVRLTVQDSMVVLLEALEANMKRYPEDQLSIYRCLVDIGKRHDDYIEKLIPILLKLDKRYLPREANVEDNLYTAYVILIVNACTPNPKLLNTLPKYIFRHFAYYKSKYPDCIPDLRKLYNSAGIKLEGDVDTLPMTFSASAKKLVEADAESYMIATVDMLRVIKKQVKRGDFSAALLTLDTATRNFKYITSLRPVIAGKSELAQLYLHCYKDVIKVKQRQTSPTYASTAQMVASSLLRHSYSIQYTFIGLTKQNLHAAMYFRVIANLVWIFGVLKQMSISNNTSLNIKNMLTAFDIRVDTIIKCFKEDNYDHSALDELKANLSKAKEFPTTSKMTALHSFIAVSVIIYVYNIITFLPNPHGVLMFERYLTMVFRQRLPSVLRVKLEPQYIVLPNPHRVLMFERYLTMVFRRRSPMSLRVKLEPYVLIFVRYLTMVFRRRLPSVLRVKLEPTYIVVPNPHSVLIFVRYLTMVFRQLLSISRRTPVRTSYVESSRNTLSFTSLSRSFSVINHSFSTAIIISPSFPH